ncbi:metallophosphoesterase family protein [Vibrio tubiashii]|uniref:Metallophosphoesterase family protein n=1 Tax=Vibrio tubiashii TaxID=29498 RepID=A0AAE5EWA3_9VIBR|nr:metallophosphoesterase family protein [Vibrio tubiashii]
MRVAVFSDVHSNFYALKAALEEIRTASVERVVFLGDLLTYGCDVNSTIELLQEFSDSAHVNFVYGNHDKIYFDKQDGEIYKYKPFPLFLDESICYTHDTLGCRLKEEFDWKQSLIIEKVFFSHANTLGNDNWSYLNSTEELQKAGMDLTQQSLSGGVFGHTHRSKIHRYSSSGLLSEQPCRYLHQCNEHEVFIANAGSIGQPRGKDASYLLLEFMSSSILIEQCFFGYEVEKHINSIVRSKLSQATKNKLMSFFKRV